MKALIWSVVFLTLASAGPLPAADTVTDGLVACWKFDDGTGKDSAGTNDAVLVGAPTMVASQSGLAMETRATAYAVADSPGLNVNGWTGITVSVWVKPVYWSGYNYGGAPGFTTYGEIIDRGTESVQGSSFVIVTPAYNHHAGGFGVNFSATNGAGANFSLFTPSTTPYPVIGNWYHLVGTYDGQYVRTYVNGVLDSSTPVTDPGCALWEPAGCKTYIGTVSRSDYRAWSDIFFSGDFDDVAIWNRGLSSNEVFQLYGGVLRSLYVSSPVGTPVPSCGTNWFISGATVTASVNAVVTLGTTQYVCTGVSVTGNTYTQVSPTNVSLTLTNDAALTWNWQTNYWLGIATRGTGTVSSDSGWQNASSSVVLTAVPGPDCHLVQWTGDTKGCMALFPTLTVPMTRPRTITAVFAAGATPVISGTITRSDTKSAMAGVTISFSGVAGTAISDTYGNYSMLVPFGWSGTATASYSSGGFAKPALIFMKITKNQAKKNFVWSPDPVISGSVIRSDTKKGMAGVTITAGSSGCNTNTDVNGNYTLTVPYNWIGKLVPAVEGGGIFKPAGKAFFLLKKNQAKVTFVFSPFGTRIARQSVPEKNATTTTLAALWSDGFAQWAHDHGLVGNAAELFDQDADGDGISNGAEYAFGANLLEGEPLVRLLTVNGVLTAEVPMQDPATLLDARESVEFALDPTSGFWFPAVCLPFNSQTPATKQWFQSGYGEAVEFRVRVELEK